MFHFQQRHSRSFRCTIRKATRTRAQLQSMLEAAMCWHASMLHSITEHEHHPDMDSARQLASLDQGAWRQQRQATTRQAQQRLFQGRRLATARDSKKRTYETMSATEQQILEDYDTLRSRKQLDEICAKRLPPFSGSLRKASAQPSR